MRTFFKLWILIYCPANEEEWGADNRENVPRRILSVDILNPGQGISFL